jgi:hypothetical protein
MLKELPFAEPAHYIGRNGAGTQQGIQVLDCRGYPVQLRPVNGKLRSVDQCLISVDRAALPALIAHLTLIMEGGTTEGVQEYMDPDDGG